MGSQHIAVPTEQLLALLSAAPERAAHHSTDSWLREDSDGLTAAAVATLLADETIAAHVATNDDLVVPSVGAFTYSPEHALYELVRIADRLSAQELPGLVAEFLASLRLDDDLVALRVTATLLGPTLVDAGTLPTSAGRLSRSATDGHPAVDIAFDIRAPASIGVVPRRPGTYADKLVGQHLLRLQLAFALAGDGPVQEGRVMVAPRFSPVASGFPLVEAGPIAVTAPYLLSNTLVFGDLDAWFRKLKTIDLLPVAVGIRRLLLARTERARPSDQLVDFAIAYEALTGLTAAKRRGPFIRRLLDAEAEAAHQRITNARNAILHDGTEPLDGQTLVADGAHLLRRLLVAAVGQGGRLGDPAESGSTHDLEPPIRQLVELPPAVAAGRAQHAVLDAALRKRSEAGVQAHLMVLDGAFLRLERDHAHFVEIADIDLQADTRWTASWLMSGRSISLAISLLTLLRARNTAGAVPVVRTMHEANRLLEVFMDRDETTLIARWLTGEAISPGQVRDAMGKKFDSENQQARELGIDIGEHVDPIQASVEMYRVFSHAAHNERSGLEEYVSPGMRLFAYRTTPEEQFIMLLAVYEQALIETMLAVGRFLDYVNQESYFEDHVRPLLDEITDVSTVFPLG